MPEKCPFCGAVVDRDHSGLTFGGNHFACGSRPADTSPQFAEEQSKACKLIVALATNERLEEELKRRDEALENILSAAVADAKNVNGASDFFAAGQCYGKKTVALRLMGKNQRIHDELNPEEATKQ